MERLTQAIVRARNNVGQDGLPVPGSEFGPGDLVPLVDTSDPYHKKIVFYRHGFKPPKYDERFEKEIRGNDIIIYSPEELPAASTRSGQLVRFDPSSQASQPHIGCESNSRTGSPAPISSTRSGTLSIDR